MIDAAEHIFWGAEVPMRVIRRFARDVAERFRPERIILFGSHAYGKPHAESDVDLLVIMPTRDKHGQAARIRWAVSAPFPMDLLVRTPREIQRGLEDGDTFLIQIVSKGKVLYESGYARMATKGRGRPSRRPTTRRSKPSVA